MEGAGGLGVRQGGALRGMAEWDWWVCRECRDESGWSDGIGRHLLTLPRFAPAVR